MTENPIEVTESKHLKRASACLRQGTIQIKIPRHWSPAYKKTVILELAQRILQQTSKFQEQVAACRQSAGPFITLSTQKELETFVNTLNRESFNAPLKAVRIGNARYTRLAQVNLKTGVMTVSKYSLMDVPLSALRYLILHELAHFYEPGHGPRFWRQVGQYAPDYRLQSRLMKIFHQYALEQSEADIQPVRKEAPASLPLKLKPPGKQSSTVNQEVDARQENFTYQLRLPLPSSG